jgi:hypothetical protein
MSDQRPCSQWHKGFSEAYKQRRGFATDAQHAQETGVFPGRVSVETWSAIRRIGDHALARRGGAQRIAHRYGISVIDLYRIRMMNPVESAQSPITTTEPTKLDRILAATSLGEISAQEAASDVESVRKLGDVAVRIIVLIAIAPFLLLWGLAFAGLAIGYTAGLIYSVGVPMAFMLICGKPDDWSDGERWGAVAAIAAFFIISFVVIRPS